MLVALELCLSIFQSGIHTAADSHTCLLWSFLLVLMLYILVNNFSVMSGHFPVFMGLTSIKLRIKSIAQGHNTLPPVSLEPVTLDPKSNTLPLSHCSNFMYIVFI